jgi:bifunctional non-homologous end joining protein LigD
MKKRKADLTRYHAKRDFRKTPEPAGDKTTSLGQRYLIQKHAARRLHYDFRLELDGVLKSWAVPRGPSLNPHDKRLAVEVEDHPVEYASFEGIIPHGQYGGGTVMLWDEGSWEAVGDARHSLKAGNLVFRLHGERLKGEWSLVRMKSSKGGRNNWLLIKKQDEYSKLNGQDGPLVSHATSIASGRSMEGIARTADEVWKGKESTEEQARKPTRRLGSSAEKGRHAAMPGFIAPELATLSSAMPEGNEWVHEIKFDGYRALSYLQDGKVKTLTRTGQDWTERFHVIADQLMHFPVQNAMLDGEIIVPGEYGSGSFSALQQALGEGADTLQYYVFDLLYLNGKDMRTLPLLERKESLRTLVQEAHMENIFYSEHFSERDKDFFTQVCRLHLEGVVSKLVDAPYRSGRSKAWLKSKCHQRQEFVIGGFTLPSKGTAGIGALLLGYYDNGKLYYAGRVGTGFNRDAAIILQKKLEKLRVKSSAFVSVPAKEQRDTRWVSPEIVCEIEFTEWTRDGYLRHPSFQGLREDKPAKDITRDVPAAPPAKKTRKPLPLGKDASVKGITITHPDRVIFPQENITKLQLAQYYAAIAAHILPYVKDRPLSMLRCPEGLNGQCFFQRHIAHGQSPYLHDTGIEVKGRNEHYLMIRDIKGLITLVQWGVIELHPWGCLVKRSQQPDRIIFDLDPGPEIDWKQLIEGAWEIRKRMQELGLESFLKTTGGKGLHVVVPIQAKHDWETVKGFAHAVAESMAHDSPKHYTVNLTKSARKGRIFIDYLRNELAATAVAPFSVRARSGATVATPLAWEELKLSLKPSAFTVKTIARRLESQKQDPWAEFLHLRQAINLKYLRALHLAA